MVGETLRQLAEDVFGEHVTYNGRGESSYVDVCCSWGCLSMSDFEMAQLNDIASRMFIDRIYAEEFDEESGTFPGWRVEGENG